MCGARRSSTGESPSERYTSRPSAQGWISPATVVPSDRGHLSEVAAKGKHALHHDVIAFGAADACTCMPCAMLSSPLLKVRKWPDNWSQSPSAKPCSMVSLAGCLWSPNGTMARLPDITTRVTLCPLSMSCCCSSVPKQLCSAHAIPYNAHVCIALVSALVAQGKTSSLATRSHSATVAQWQGLNLLLLPDKSGRGGLLAA